MNRRIEDFRNSCSGPVALLGGGESVKQLDLGAIAAEMFVVGINESWRGFPTQWRVVVDYHLQRFVEGETVFYPVGKHGELPPLPPNVTGVPIRHLPRHGEPEFMGFRLDEGTYGYFAGMLALEVVTWCGFDPIRLLGFDCKGGYWMSDVKQTPGGARTHAIWKRQLDEAIAKINEAGRTIVW